MAKYLAAIVISMAFVFAGCAGSSASKHLVSHDADEFTETANGRTVQFKAWKLTVGTKSIELPHEKTEIIIESKGSHLEITANGKKVYED